MKVRNHVTVEAGFTMVPNSLITDAGLSIEARMLWLYLASLSSGWDTNRGKIAKALGVGVYTVRTRLTELAEANLTEMVNIRQDDGTFVHELHLRAPVVGHQSVDTSGRSSASGQPVVGGQPRVKPLVKPPVKPSAKPLVKPSGRSSASGQSARSIKTDSKKTEKKRIKKVKERAKPLTKPKSAPPRLCPKSGYPSGETLERLIRMGTPSATSSKKSRKKKVKAGPSLSENKQNIVNVLCQVGKPMWLGDTAQLIAQPIFDTSQAIEELVSEKIIVRKRSGILELRGSHEDRR